jgi:hypothetical protein
MRKLTTLGAQPERRRPEPSNAASIVPFYSPTPALNLPRPALTSLRHLALYDADTTLQTQILRPKPHTSLAPLRWELGAARPVYRICGQFCQMTHLAQFFQSMK